jgi:hypothetical protein
MFPTGAVAPTLLSLGAPDALRAAAAAAVPHVARGAAKGGGSSDGSDCDPDLDAAWTAAFWAALAAIKLPREAAASHAPCAGPSSPADALAWALELVSGSLSGARGAPHAATALNAMASVPGDVLRALARHPGLLLGVGAFVGASEDAECVESGLELVRTMAELEKAPRAAGEAEGGCAAACSGEPGGPGALGELRRWLSMLARAPDRAVAWEAAAGLAAFDTSRLGAGKFISGRGSSDGGDGDGGRGASEGRGAVASSGGGSSGEAPGSAGGSTSQQVTAALSPQRRGRPIRSCSVCGQTEEQLGRAPKACAGCRKVRCAGVRGNACANLCGRRVHLARSPPHMINRFQTCSMNDGRLKT